MVSIAAFQAVDPGSIPGHRIFFLKKKVITVQKYGAMSAELLKLS
jgi:hypothetical protein